MIFFVIALILLFLPPHEVALFSVHKWFVRKKIDLTGYSLNLFDDSILSKKGEEFISSHSQKSIYSHYYINGLGRVWKYGKLHKEIEQKFKELKND